MDNLERATLTVLNRKHQFIMELGKVGRVASEIKKILELIDYDKEILWATMIYDNCDKQAELQANVAEPQGQTQAQSGS